MVVRMRVGGLVGRSLLSGLGFRTEDRRSSLISVAIRVPENRL